MKLVKITQKEVIKNREKYFHDKKQFLVRIEGAKYYRTATIVRFVDWDDDLRKEVYYYRFEYENYDRDNFEDWACFDEIYLIEE